jgi:hypothetical protein
LPFAAQRQCCQQSINRALARKYPVLFPDCREKNREFFRIQGNCADQRGYEANDFRAFGPNSLPERTGNSFDLAGHFYAEQGISLGYPAINRAKIKPD